jgi:hypothetical protein
MMRKLQVLGIGSLAFVFAVPLQGQGTTGVNNAELKGDYAFTFNGMTTGGGGGSTPFAAVGRFTSDGAGNLTNGVLDTNGVGVPEKLIDQAFTGTYSIGTDNRGVMNLNIPGGGKLAFVMMSNGTAKFVEIDASGGNGTVGSGSMEKADTTAYSTSKIVGDYAFGVAGFDLSNNRTAIAGRMTANGAGTFTSGAADANQSGTFTTLNVFASSYLVTDTSSGRGMLNLPPLAGGIPQNLNFVFYVVKSGKIFAMESDAPSPATPLLNGVFLQQQTPLGGFSNASLNGGMVMYLTGRVGGGCGSNSGAAPNVIAGLLTSNAIGALTLTYDQNCGGAATSVTALAGTSSVAASGRTGIQLGGSYMVAYLVSSNQAFFVVPDSSVLFGFGDPQTAAPLTNGALTGAYAGLATVPMTLGVTIFSGEFTANGASPTGSIIGSEDIGAPGGASSGVSVNSTYSISSTPTNGRGSFSGSVGGSSAIVYVVSPTKFVLLSTSDSNPALLVFEQ